MLRLLLRLWWLQQRRNFRKRDAFVACYIIFLYVVMGVSFFLSFTENGGELGGEDMPALLGAGIVVGMLIPDIIMKMVMKRDITAMDDYVKSRPVPEKIWNKFLLTTNLVSFWNYVLPVLMLPVFIYFLPVGQVIASFFLFLAFSYIDGIYITCYRKATEWILKWPLILGWMGMFAVLIGYMFVASFFPVWMGWIGIFFLAGAVFAGLTIYLYHEKIYNEQKQKVSRFRGFSHINLFSLQYIGTLRAKRVRTMVIMITAIFLFDAYLFALLPAEAGQEMGDKVAMTTLYVAGAILLPSVVLSQWTFGIEANFFHGLMTKPVKVKQMLQNCFYYYMVVSAVALLLTLPFLFLQAGIGIQVLISGFCLAVFINLFNLPTALFSSRLEIFQTSMFSMQGANLKINLYAIAFLFPLAGVCAVYYFFGETAWFITCVALAVFSIAIHKYLEDRSKEHFLQLLQEKTAECQAIIHNNQEICDTIERIKDDMHVKELNSCRHLTLSWQNDRLLRLTPLAESDDGKSRITKFARHGQRRAHHKGALPNHAGWVLDQESFFKKHEFQRSQAYFSCVTSATKHRQSIKMTLPAGLYLEIIFSGTFCENAEKLSQRIERFLQTNDLEPVLASGA